ncbi:hypothetical protein B0H15DRAFT_942633 [Mycena belliarum]|uniref:Uncharacterized protein n=1 Tax=Mycena belliarum TaxID=1033014 RepID=A0AAD6Y1I6_9AGAR|nr:hypothetical protein B0H15DRAFT_942633 [Mycena belliae]
MDVVKHVQRPVERYSQGEVEQGVQSRGGGKVLESDDVEQQLIYHFLLPTDLKTSTGRLDDCTTGRLDDERLAGMNECRASRAAEGRLVVHRRLYRGESSLLRGAQRVPCRDGGRLNASGPKRPGEATEAAGMPY